MRFTLVSLVIGLALLCGTAPALAQSTATTLEINFTDLEAGKGAVLFALFDSEGAYDGKGAPVRSTMAPVGKGTATARLEGLAPGTYAVKAFHDVNGNGQMDTNPFGMPVEPFAFSQNAKGKMGPASWSQAHFEVTAGANRTTISFR